MQATNPVFHKGLYFAVYEVVMDLAGVALLAGCGFFAYRRWKRPPEIGHEWLDWLILVFFAIIGVTGYVLEGLRIVREQTPMPGVSFVGVLFARGFESAGMTLASASAWHIGVWWFHAVLALTLIALFPYTRLLHGIAGTVRLAAGIERLGRLSPISVSAGGGDRRNRRDTSRAIQATATCRTGRVCFMRPMRARMSGLRSRQTALAPQRGARRSPTL